MSVDFDCVGLFDVVKENSDLLWGEESYLLLCANALEPDLITGIVFDNLLLNGGS